mgnify:CR=1 FL=1
MLRRLVRRVLGRSKRTPAPAAPTRAPAQDAAPPAASPAPPPAAHGGGGGLGGVTPSAAAGGSTSAEICIHLQDHSGREPQAHSLRLPEGAGSRDSAAEAGAAQRRAPARGRR